MSTLQHTSQLRVRATRRLVLIIVVATLALAGVTAAIVAIGSGGGGSATARSAQPTSAGRLYTSGSLEQQLAPVK